MTTNILSNRRRKLSGLKANSAFSLIELLVVIAIIGIIAAIAIPNIGNLTGSAGIARDQRNAQTITSVCSAAMAAGYKPTGATGKAEVAILIGPPAVTGPDVPNSTFKLDMDINDYTPAVQKYLNYSTASGFSYVKDGTGTAD